MTARLRTTAADAYRDLPSSLARDDAATAV
jgi:hypothetical protein